MLKGRGLWLLPGPLGESVVVWQAPGVQHGFRVVASDTQGREKSSERGPLCFFLLCCAHVGRTSPVVRGGTKRVGRRTGESGCGPMLMVGERQRGEEGLIALCRFRIRASATARESTGRVQQRGKAYGEVVGE